MADVVGVVFQDGGKTYHFDSAGLDLSRGDRVVVQTSKGSEIGQVVEPTHHVDDSELPASLKKVVRLATGADLEAQACGQCKRKEAMATCRELIAAHDLDMKLVSADVSFGGERVTFNFYSDERVDFRALVADLAKALQMRVELRQIGAREEARMIGGLGPCGRHLCCALFQGDEDPVSIRMAKEQNLPLNPVKISGLCGRLMCCLKYEQEQYVTFRKEAPPRGTRVSTPTGDGVISGFNVPKESITVRLEDGSFTDVRLDYCEAQDDGSLLFVAPVEEEPVHLSIDPAAPLAGMQAISEDEELQALALGNGEQVGEPGNGADGGAQADEGRSRRSRSRRSRGRRGRGQAGAEEVAGAATAEGEGLSAGGASGGAAGAAGQSGQQRSRRSSRKHKDRPQEGGNAARGAGDRAQTTGDEGGAAGQPGNGERKSRRRRRSRKPSGGEGRPGSGAGGEGGSAPTATGTSE